MIVVVLVVVTGEAGEAGRGCPSALLMLLLVVRRGGHDGDLILSLIISLA